MSDSSATEDHKPTVDVDAAIRRNPGVNASQLKEAREALGELRRQGLARHTYNLASPYAPRRRARQP